MQIRAADLAMHLRELASRDLGSASSTGWTPDNPAVVVPAIAALLVGLNIYLTHRKRPAIEIETHERRSGSGMHLRISVRNVTPHVQHFEAIAVSITDRRPKAYWRKRDKHEVGFIYLDLATLDDSNSLNPNKSTDFRTTESEILDACEKYSEEHNCDQPKKVYIRPVATLGNGLRISLKRPKARKVRIHS
jgi:hypothetical protein